MSKGIKTVRRLSTMLTLLGGVLLAACGTNTSDLPDPIETLNAAAVYFNEAETFKIEVLQEGATYYIDTDVTEGALAFQRATIRYQAPDTLQGEVRGSVFGAPFPFGILARGEKQWTRLPAIGWSDAYVFAPGFDPQDLIAEESGFQAALGALNEIEMAGAESLNGVPVYRMTGRASGQAVEDLLVGLIDAGDEVFVDVYVRRDDNLPIRLEITMPGTETEEEPEPTKWIVEVYDFDVPVTIDGPTLEDQATQEVSE